MDKKVLMRIDDPDDIKFLMNKLSKVNDIMKKTTYFDEADCNIGFAHGKIVYKPDDVGYLIFDFSLVSSLYKPCCFPREIEIDDIVYNKKEQERVDRLNEEYFDLFGTETYMFIPNPNDLYAFIRDYKSVVTLFEIYDDNTAKIITKNSNMYFTIRIVGNDFIDAYASSTIDISENVSSIELDGSNENDAELIDIFIKTRGIFDTYFNTESNEVFINPSDEKLEELKDNLDVCKITISTKYMTGMSGMKGNKSKLLFDIYTLENTVNDKSIPIDNMVQLDITFINNNKMRIRNSYIMALVV